MNFLIAQLKKDIIPLRLLLGGWAACWLVDLVTAVLRSHAIEGGGGFVFIAILCLPAQFFLIAALTVRVIQEDSLADDGAFWRTRPIPRLGLLGAKALLTVPLLVASLAVVGIAFPQKDVSTWLSSAAIFLGLTAFATVTPTVGRMIGMVVLVCFLAGLVAGIIHGAANADMSFGTHHWHSHVDPFPAISAHSKEITLALFLIGFPIGIVHQYLTLRTRTSIQLLVGIVFVACLV